MNAVAPELAWINALEGTSGGGWEGTCPVWPFDRSAPPGLDAFLDGARFQIGVRVSPAHPVVAPRVYPHDPQPDMSVRTRQEWHVLGDGGLCLLRETLDWTGKEPAAELVRKAAGWFLEFRLLTDGLIDRMTPGGIVNDNSLDYLLGGDR